MCFLVLRYTFKHSLCFHLQSKLQFSSAVKTWKAHCCTVLRCFLQRWSHGSSGSKQRAQWIIHNWPLTLARMNWLSVPGNLHPLCFSLFSLLLLSSFLLPSPFSSLLFTVPCFISLFLQCFLSPTNCICLCLYLHLLPVMGLSNIPYMFSFLVSWALSLADNNTSINENCEI